MGNSKSSSSQFPYHGNNNESDQSKKKETEGQTSAASSALKLGAAMAGAAIIGYGVWSLSSSSSDSTENKSQKVGVKNKSEAGFMWNPELQLESCTGDYGYHGSVSRLIKLMSYNVWSREDVEVNERMEAIGQLIQEHSPDVILFQEITPNIYGIFQSSQWWTLYECSVPQEKATRKYFCMLLSKLNVKRFKNQHFDNSTKGICWAELDVGSNNKLVVATSHLKSQTPTETNSTKRITQAKEALSCLNNFPNVVFGGDMNWDENSDGPFPFDDDWVDAWAKLKPGENGYTFDTNENKSLRGHWPLQKRLDRFVCKLSDFKIIEIKMIGQEAIPHLSYKHNKKANPVYPSDHFGLLLTISTL